MKFSACLLIAAVGVVPLAAVGFGDGVRRQHGLLRATERFAARSSSTSSGSSRSVQAFEAKFGTKMVEMMKGMLTGKGPGPQTIAKLMHSRMDIKDAMQQLDGKLPQDVASLVRMSTSEGKGGSVRTTFDEASLQKARGILNNMIFTAWKELDDVIFECKVFQEMNRGTYEQVTTDIARLGSQLATLGEQRVDSNEGIMEQDRQRKEAEATIEKTTTSFKQVKLLNDQEMTIRKNDLAVFDMILMMTKCPEPATFLQVGLSRGVTASTSSEKGNQSLRVCITKDDVHFQFPDPKLQAKVERMMTKDAKLALRLALGQVVAKSQPSFLEVGSDKQPSTSDSNTTTAFPTYAAETVPVIEEPAPDGQWKKCVDGPVNCGLLHDLMSMEWGKFRDSFDVLATEMQTNQDEYDKFMENMNQELNVINDEKTKHMEILATTISSINADTEEMNEKDDQKRDLQDEHDRKMAEFKAACTELLYTRICGVRTVRNQIMWDSTLSPPSNMSDCDFTDWYPKDGACIGIRGTEIDCDDTCPNADPYKCGGLETMVRDVVVAPNEYGMQCPQLERVKKCNQFKCPVDCVESEWSGWSKCTKDCESGVKVRTRAVLTKAKNGGKSCDTVQEEESCNTDSCDRDCSLDVWTSWSPCSMACGGGDTERIRTVTVPIRGQGKCPRPKSPSRYAKKDCNTQACVGDEICIARQDLVLAIDGSGSLRESGFEVVRDFSANLTRRYKSLYYGLEDMKLGVVFFGNGVLEAQPDGTTTIAEALYIQGLTGDLQLVQDRIQELTWLRGFTNMAQGFHMADVMLGQTGRGDAQSAVMVISDGKFSMEFQTAEKARELRDKNVMIYLVPITEVKGAELKTFRRFSSSPHSSNFVRVPGLQALKYNADLFTGKIIAKFCPNAFSPSQQMAKEEELQYMLINEKGYPSDSCGAWTWHGKGFNKDSCMQQAMDDGRLSFAFGFGDYMAGGCYTEAIEVTEAFWQSSLTNKYDPPCPNGHWVRNPYFDTYIIKPSSLPVIPGTGIPTR